MIQNWSLRKKIVLLGGLQMAVVTGVLFYLHYRQAKDTTKDEYVARARSIILTAESVREEMARKWKLGLFDDKTLVGRVK